MPIDAFWKRYVVSSCERSQISAVPLAAGTASGSHPLMGFFDERQMEVRSNDTDTIDDRYEGDIRSRRRPFSVLWRPAPSQSDRFEAVQAS